MIACSGMQDFTLDAASGNHIDDDTGHPGQVQRWDAQVRWIAEDWPA